MQRIFGYCRISRPTKNIERQERNIIKAYPTARIYKEAYTGTKTAGRKELEKLLRQVQGGDIIVFDSVSRMSRNAAEGITETLKAENQMLWVQRMNIVRQTATEVVYHNLICV